ncbi:MAG: hypothetical protein ACXADA_24490 [Candidatus Hodarchaeales archaeon]|jgi:hypothetical protein
MEISRTSLVSHYLIVILVVLVIHLIVFTLSPGNLIAAIIASVVIMIILLPSSTTCDDHESENSSSINRNDRTKMSDGSLTSNEESRSIDDQVMDSEEVEFHSVLGKVFDTMAQNANQDLYSAEITGTSRLFHGENNGLKRSDPVDIDLKVDPDSIMHLLFQENANGVKDAYLEQDKTLTVDTSESFTDSKSENSKTALKRRKLDDFRQSNEIEV